MQKEWRTTDSNTIIDDCDECFNRRPVKRMLDPYFKDEDLDEYEADEIEELMSFYCFLCYQNELDKY
jgi:hypothetical protein